MATNRWSLTNVNADFSKAKVKVQRLKKGKWQPVKAVKHTPVKGDGTLVWDMPVKHAGKNARFKVNVSKIVVNGRTVKRNYVVRYFMP